MAVVVHLHDGSQYKVDDEDGGQTAYNVSPSGSLAIIIKPADSSVVIRREFSPSGYVWVEGKRFGGDLGKQSGIDGKLEFSRPRVQSF